MTNTSPATATDATATDATATDTAGTDASATDIATAAALPVRPGEEPWSESEVVEIREELGADLVRITAELEASELDLEGLMRDYGGGSGDDSADTGGRVSEREQGLTLTHNTRVLLEQTRRALARLEHGTYGLCESCEQPIGKLRLQAFPRATLCVSCKQRQERR